MTDATDAVSVAAANDPAHDVSVAPTPGPANGASVAGSGGQVHDEVLRSMHTELDTIDEVHVDDRIEVFERLNRTLAHELAALDEV